MRTWAATLLLFAVTAARAADPTIDNLRLGDGLHGPKLSADVFKNHVVFVEFWGIT